MSHVAGTHTSIALFLFLPSVLSYSPLLIKTHAHTSPLMYQPGLKLGLEFYSCEDLRRNLKSNLDLQEENSALQMPFRFLPALLCSKFPSLVSDHY